MDFGWAIRRMKEGGAVTRVGWNGKGMWIKAQVPDEHSKMTLPYFYMSTVTGDLVPWLASQTDMWAEDWMTPDPAADALMALGDPDNDPAMKTT